MASAALARLVADGVASGFDSLLVVRHGRIVAEAYYAPYTADIPHQVHSATKAIVGTLIGMLHKDGVLDRLDHPVLDFFADRHVAHVDARKRAITIQNLMDMTSGFDWDQGVEEGKEQTLVEMTLSPNWTQFILDRPMAHAPGDLFNYADANPNLASAIVTRLTGRLAEDYARQRLFGPLGITDWHWDRDPQGLSIGAWALTMLPRDMAKIGYLYLRHGVWDGRQLLPAGWTDVLSHPLVDMHAAFDPALRYANFFWVFPERAAYMAVGWHGQLIAVFPDLDVVAVVTAHKFVPFRRVIADISTAIKSPTALPPDADGVEQLAGAVKGAAVEQPTVVGSTSELASDLSGKTYRFTDDRQGLRSVALFFGGPNPHLELEINSRLPLAMYNFSGTIDLPFGSDGHYRRSAPSAWGTNPGHVTAAKGTWLDRQTFELDVQDVGFGGMSKYVLRYDGRTLRFTRTDPWGRTTTLDGMRVD